MIFFGSLLIQFFLYLVCKIFVAEGNIYMEEKSTLEMKTKLWSSPVVLGILTHFSSSFNIFSIAFCESFNNIFILIISSSRASSCYVFIIFYALLWFFPSHSRRSTMMHNLIERTGKKNALKRSLNIIYIWSPSIRRLNWDINDRKGSKITLMMLRIN